jgi:hypothetical protein
VQSTLYWTKLFLGALLSITPNNGSSISIAHQERHISGIRQMVFLLYRPAFQSNPPTITKIRDGHDIISCLTVEPMLPAIWTPMRPIPNKIKRTPATLSPTFLFTFGGGCALGAAGGALGLDRTGSADLTLAETGAPQCGHVVASVDRLLLHSTQLMRGII